MNIDSFRRRHLAIAELIDAWRVVPRLLVAGYSYVVWDTVEWYQLLADPTTQHTACLSAIVGASAVVFGFYTNSGSKWANGIVLWDKSKVEKTEEETKPSVAPK